MIYTPKTTEGWNSRAVLASHHLAPAAAHEASSAGGKAIVAALATVTRPCMVHPKNVALGGELVATVTIPGHEAKFHNTIRSFTITPELRGKHGKALPLRGIDRSVLGE